MPDAYRAVIHALFADHEKIDREVEITDTGYRATTTSSDARLAGWIQEHVAQMDDRLKSGRSVRQWDPAFAELRAHYSDLEITFEGIDNGIAVVVVGRTPEAIRVAQNHAKIVSGFVAKGEEVMHARHATALGDSEKQPADVDGNERAKSAGDVRVDHEPDPSAGR